MGVTLFSFAQIERECMRGVREFIILHSCANRDGLISCCNTLMTLLFQLPFQFQPLLPFKHLYYQKAVHDWLLDNLLTLEKANSMKICVFL